MAGNNIFIMNTGPVIFVIGLIVIAVGVTWILTGGNTGPLFPGTPMPIPTATPAPAQGSLPPSGSGEQEPPVQATVTVPAPAPTPLPTQQVSSDDIKLHFMDLAFGAGTTYLERWNRPDTNGRTVISVFAGDDSDAMLLSGAAREFNSLSQTIQLSDNIKDGLSSDIAIRFIPGEGMVDILLNTSDSLTKHDVRINGSTVAEVTPGIIYIDGALRGEQRNHTLMRSLYYELGVNGETQKYPDSLFYSGENTNVNLTYADRGAIAILYGPGLSPGMTADAVKKILYSH